MENIFETIRPVVIVLHALSASIGFGTVVVTDTLFFSYIKDYRISSLESSTMKILSRVIWTAFAVLVLTGILLYFSDPARYSVSSKFLVKTVGVVIILINGFVLNYIVTPALSKIAFGKGDRPDDKYRSVRKLAFATGAISMTTWTTVFILGSIRSIPLSFTQGVTVFAVVLASAIIGSQVFDMIVARRKL